MADSIFSLQKPMKNLWFPTASHMQSLHAGAPLEAIASKGRTALACAAAFHLNQDSQARKYWRRVNSLRL